MAHHPEVMTPAYHHAQLLSNTLVGEQVRHVVIRPDQALPYQAGQFFLLRLRHPESGEYVERSYSAANFGDGTSIEFVIRIEAKGQMTSLIDNLKEGESIDIKGPFGRFGLSELPEDAKALVLIAGGVGISPLRSMVQQLCSSDSEIPIQLFYGFRTPDDFLFQSELESIDSLQVVTSISEEAPPGWTGNRGFITEHLEETLLSAGPQVHAFICGPPPMVKATRQKLFDLGYDRGNVHVEAW